MKMTKIKNEVSSRVSFEDIEISEMFITDSDAVCVKIPEIDTPNNAWNLTDKQFEIFDFSDLVVKINEIILR